MAVGPLNYKVTEVNCLEDPRAFGTSLVWSVSVLWVSAHNLNWTQVIWSNWVPEVMVAVDCLVNKRLDHGGKDTQLNEDGEEVPIAQFPGSTNSIS